MFIVKALTHYQLYSSWLYYWRERPSLSLHPLTACLSSGEGRALPLYWQAWSCTDLVLIITDSQLLKPQEAGSEAMPRRVFCSILFLAVALQSCDSSCRMSPEHLGGDIKFPVGDECLLFSLWTLLSLCCNCHPSQNHTRLLTVAPSYGCRQNVYKVVC